MYFLSLLAVHELHGRRMYTTLITRYNVFEKSIAPSPIPCKVSLTGSYTSCLLFRHKSVGNPIALSFLYFRSSWMILCTIPYDIPRVAESSRIVTCLFSAMSSSIFFFVSSLWTLVCLSLRCRSLMSLLLLEEYRHHFLTCYIDIVDSPYKFRKCSCISFGETDLKCNSLIVLRRSTCKPDTLSTSQDMFIRLYTTCYWMRTAETLYTSLYTSEYNSVQFWHQTVQPLAWKNRKPYILMILCSLKFCYISAICSPVKWFSKFGIFMFSFHTEGKGFQSTDCTYESSLEQWCINDGHVFLSWQSR